MIKESVIAIPSSYWSIPGVVEAKPQKTASERWASYFKRMHNYPDYRGYTSLLEAYAFGEETHFHQLLHHPAIINRAKPMIPGFLHKHLPVEPQFLEDVDWRMLRLVAAHQITATISAWIQRCAPKKFGEVRNVLSSLDVNDDCILTCLVQCRKGRDSIFVNEELDELSEYGAFVLELTSGDILRLFDWWCKEDERTRQQYLNRYSLGDLIDLLKIHRVEIYRQIKHCI